MLAVAEKEGGKPGQWVRNSNGTYDVGYMQFNTAYLKSLKKYGIEAKHVAAGGCYSYDLAAWRISAHLRDGQKGDMWTRVANYHSTTPKFNGRYKADLIRKAVNKRVFGLVIDFGTSQSPKSTRPLTTYWCPSRPGHQALRNNFASSLLLRTWLPYDWTPRSEAYFVFPLAQGTPGKQCGLAATGVYQPSLRSPWLAANAIVLKVSNGPAEGLNSRIKMIKVRSRGFRNKERFANAIYFHLGGLDLYPDGITR